mgnify:CR=1 FL=1|jgi:hypothetical protein|tara:strand:+ start:30166 stop:30372 length:207 start_codon:yes stop_codon:yes gene_type:complete
MKVGDLVKPKPAYLDDEASPPVGMIIEEHHCDGGGHLEPETEFIVQWPADEPYPAWQDFELELVSESR